MPMPPKKPKDSPTPSCNVSVRIDDYASVAAMADKDLYNRFMAVCGRSVNRIVPPAVKWDRFRVTRSRDSVSVCLFKGQKEAFRFSFVPAARTAES